MSHTYAQTNLQLFGQMERQGYAAGDVLAVAGAYGLARKVFHGHFRGSGKAFLEHLVGTASILVCLKASVPLLTAALLHSLYSHGLPPPVLVPPWRRARVRRLVGPDAETLITLYSQLPWRASTMPLIAFRLGKLDPIRRQVVLLRLVNELEDQLDLGVLLCGNAAARCFDLRRTVAVQVRMADQLGLPLLATELDRAFARTLAHENDTMVMGLRSPDRFSFREGLLGRPLGRVRQRIAWGGARALALASLRSPAERTHQWLGGHPLAAYAGST